MPKAAVRKNIVLPVNNYRRSFTPSANFPFVSCIKEPHERYYNKQRYFFPLGDHKSPEPVAYMFTYTQAVNIYK